MSILHNTKFNVNFLDVGHGDCAVIRWNNGLSKKPWICVIDSGKDKKQLEDFLLKNDIYRVNLAITSHFDLDHIGGYLNLDKKIKIEEYWSPYTPAFKKNIWLFGDRVKKSIQRAEKLEEELISRGTTLISPLEGFRYSPTEGLKIKVLYPAYKLYDKLLSNKDINFLFESYPTPLNWLIEETDETFNAEDINVFQQGLNERISGNLIRRDLEEEKKELEQVKEKTFIDQEIIESWSKKTKIEPEFFGNHILNDTSIVLKLEVWTGSVWNTLLFPGDIQNWLYLMAKKPNDLVSDIYKVAHHGSNMYLAQEIKYDEIIQSIRPKLSIISANGEYGLPKTKVRDVIARWSTTLACTQHKSCDTISLNGISFGTDCCHDQHSCIKYPKPINDEYLGISVEIKNSQMKIEPPPCIHSAYSSPIPIIQLEQHLVSDSKILTYLSEKEINIHVRWLTKVLNQIHNNRKASNKPYTSTLITLDQIRRFALKEDRYLTEKQISQIIEYGYSKGKFLSHRDDNYRAEKWNIAYRKPTKGEINKIISNIYKKDILISSTKSLKSLKCDAYTFLLDIERKLFCKEIEELTAYPQKLGEDYIWTKLIDELISNFNILYLPNEDEKFDKNILILLVKKTIDYNEYIKHIREEIKRKIEEEIEEDIEEDSYTYYAENKYGIPKYDRFVSIDYLLKEFIWSSKWQLLSVQGLNMKDENFYNRFDDKFKFNNALLMLDKLLASRWDILKDEYVSNFCNLF